ESSENFDENDDENYDTGDASLDNTRNQDGIGENELLVLSFGTSFNDNRRLTIGAIENDIEKAFPDYSVRRGFTSNIIIDHVKKRDGVSIDDINESLQRAVDNGVKNLVVQPTHLMNGIEYDELVGKVADYADSFDKISIGEPLLTSDEDFKEVEKAITEWTSEYDDGETAICFMGHGTEAESNAVYTKMQDMLTADGYRNYFIGTVEASPTLDDVMKSVKAGNYKRVVLQPLMVVAGDHANNDMAGDEEDSWKSAFEKEGYKVECLIRGLGENERIRNLYVNHAKKAVESLSGMSAVPVQNTENTELSPVYASDLNDGVYKISVDSSSSMFNITDCELTVADGKMTAVMTMGGTGYLYVFMGKGENATESEYIPFEEQSDGTHTFTVPVESLNTETECSAFSKKKEEWYDRTLVFNSDLLPQEAFKNSEDTKLKDGEYTVEVSLEGGSGKATIESPAKLTVENGQAYAEIVWNSPNYDYMICENQKYLPINTDGNSVFEIPVSAFDEKINVSADTTAMSTPHEIEYTLYFNSESIKNETD
ncbi:MAG: sirohydrochlorin cobaltochelatase, partial [Ruminococcus sp.]